MAKQLSTFAFSKEKVASIGYALWKPQPGVAYYAALIKDDCVPEAEKAAAGPEEVFLYSLTDKSCFWGTFLEAIPEGTTLEASSPPKCFADLKAQLEKNQQKINNKKATKASAEKTAEKQAQRRTAFAAIQQQIQENSDSELDLPLKTKRPHQNQAESVDEPAFKQTKTIVIDDPDSKEDEEENRSKKIVQKVHFEFWFFSIFIYFFAFVLQNSKQMAAKTLITISPVTRKSKQKIWRYFSDM